MHETQLETGVVAIIVYVVVSTAYIVHGSTDKRFSPRCCEAYRGEPEYHFLEVQGTLRNMSKITSNISTKGDVGEIGDTFMKLEKHYTIIVY